MSRPLEGNLPQMVEEGRRVLLFSGFATLLGHLEPVLQAYGIPYSKITGQTVDRQAQIEAFQSGKTHVFLITLKAGGVGLNLTAADTVIHYDPWWNPATENQAVDRTHRIGQSKKVMVYRMVAENTIEEKVMELKQRKADLFSAVLDDDRAFSSAITANDIRSLLSP